MASSDSAKEHGHTPMRTHVWLARGAFAAALAAVVVLVVFAGFKSVALVTIGALGLVVMGAGAYGFLASRGPQRWLALAVVALAPIAVVILFIRGNLFWISVLTVGLAVVSVLAGTAALTGRREESMPTQDAPPPQRPFLIMNPHSGGGKVEKFGLRQRAEALGAEVVLLDGPERIDVADLARQAVRRGADLLGVAGGDGTQAIVAGIAAEHDVPFLVISAGTRNHFALDLGLDREDPVKGLDALRDGVELRVDLGSANGRTFVNNVSFGAYAEIVQDPAYRDDKVRTTLNTLPDLLAGRRGARLAVQAEETNLDGPQAVLISNNPYELGDPAGLGRRARLDEGTLGVVAVSVDNVRQAIGVFNRAHDRGLSRFSATEVTVSAAEQEVPVGIDGEAVTLTTPVSCVINPRALRVRVPRERPGAPKLRSRLDWVQLRQLAFSRAGR
jgi:diacylglycerol kinase family enzyme